MLPFDEALALIESYVRPLGSEIVTLADAQGRVTAEPLVARCDSPRHAVSAMDGYAVVEATTSAGEPLQVIGEARAGTPFAGKVGAGQAVRIFTGARLPEGADLVIMQEYASREGDRIEFAAGFGPARHIRPQAGDFSAGTELVPRGTRLDARAMVTAAAADCARLEVTRRPRVAIISTGDELAEPGSAHLSPDRIPESVSYGIAAMVGEEGGVVVSRATGADDLGLLSEAAGKALGMADLVITIGGASVGERDFAKPMFEPHGLSLAFEKVAMKPGKPVWLGEAQGVVVLGLPGNPTSALVTASLFLRPILARLHGADARAGRRWRHMPLAAPVEATGSRETFVRARWEAGGLVPVGNQDSGAQAALLGADWLIRRPASSPGLEAGAMVEAIAF